jgi:hypothetical protein
MVTHIQLLFVIKLNWTVFRQALDNANTLLWDLLGINVPTYLTALLN